MDHFNNPSTVSNYPKKGVFLLPSESVLDKAKVKLGGLSPAFRKVSIEDKGKVRLGGLGPIFRS